ncbi:MAG TPA: beta-propeller fold lactonase family protein [Alphaproteobacteria bacterium]|nr:beta-propeller fold lactonase family protein [Alphaproteobacteria bacterium]
MRAKTLPALLAVLGLLTGCASNPNNFVYVMGKGTNQVFAFTEHSKGDLTPLATPTFGTGSGPVAMAIHPSRSLVYIANFSDNNLMLLDRSHSSGDLTVPANPNPVINNLAPNLFPVGTGPVSVVISGDGRFLYALNQGSHNISGFNLNSTNGVLTEMKSTTPAANQSPFPTPVSPSAMAISPSGSLLYVANPTLGTISGFLIGADGFLTAQTPVAAGTTPTWITIDPSGKFLYVADAGTNKVLGFTIQSGGALTAISGSPFTAGNKPVAMATDAHGAFLYVANQNSNDISAYVIDSNSGALGAIANSPFAAGSGPAFIGVDQATSFLYVCLQGTNDIAAFSIQGNGSLTPVAGSPFSVATTPQWIVTSKD